MLRKILIALTLLAGISAEKDGNWVWGDNSRKNNVQNDFDLSERREASARYEIYEPNNNYPPLNNFNENNAPFQSGPGPLPVQRPGGVYGQGRPPINPGYGEGGIYPGGNRPDAGILTGPIPSWVKEGPFREFDHCKCSERFNCQSPGISYGHCDVGKKYCCYSRKPGGPLPSRPIHSPENGVLVGPGGPIDPIPGVNQGFNGNRRPYPGPGVFQRPGTGGFGLGGRPQGFLGRPVGRPEGFIGRPGQNIHSPENGILVGPGGPVDGPFPGQYDSEFRSRSATNKKN